jgi:hypothetical protein
MANLLDKDLTTVSKQLDPNKGNPTLANIDMIVKELGAKLVLSTPETPCEPAHIIELERLREENARLQLMLYDKDERIARRDKIIKDQYSDLQHIRDVLERKDELLEALVKKELLKG